MGMRPSGKNTWTIEVRTRSDANSALITGVDSGTHGGNGSVNGEQFTYRVYRND